MRRSKILLATSALAISVALTGCSGDSSDEAGGSDQSASASESGSPSESESASEAGSNAYCDELDSAQGDFTALAEGDAAAIDRKSVV